MKHYVIGFYFTQDYQRVALIRKKKPDKLNGVGGHVEDRETFTGAMIREFDEETGRYEGDWFLKATQMGYDYSLCVFMAVGPEFNPIEAEEQVTFYNVREVLSNPDLIPNCVWMIGLCLDKKIDNVVQVLAT